MNLVKAQEYAQSLPLAELKKYADGLNPSMIPPWLATGEMEAKTKRAEMANNLAGAATGEQPSIKEQVEQKAANVATIQVLIRHHHNAAVAQRARIRIRGAHLEPQNLFEGLHFGICMHLGKRRFFGIYKLATQWKHAPIASLLRA